eukprot:6155919-Pleurochrysis_carterae.AAC.4
MGILAPGWPNSLLLRVARSVPSPDRSASTAQRALHQPGPVRPWRAVWRAPRAPDQPDAQYARARPAAPGAHLAPINKAPCSLNTTRAHPFLLLQSLRSRPAAWAARLAESQLWIEGCDPAEVAAALFTPTLQRQKPRPQ